MAWIALAAASTLASSVKWSRRVPVDQPEPLASLASTIAVRKLMISVDSSLWTSGMCEETSAMRSWRIVTSPPRISPRRLTAASLPARSTSREDAMKVRSAPVTTFQPACTSSSSRTSRSFGSW